VREKRNAYKTFIGNPERKRQIERPRLRWGYNIRTGRREVGWKLWIELIWLEIWTSVGML
jgi:hypothetical protein